MSQNEIAFLLSWSCTTTIAAVYYYIRMQALSRSRLWGVKMLVAMDNGAARVTREGRKLTFHYENDQESNTICIEAK